MHLTRIGALFGVLAWVLTLAPAAYAAEDPGRPLQWGLGAVGAPEAWSTGSGDGITIAVVDTGVDLAHEDLQGRLVPGKNFVDPSKQPQDDHGHGTHVAGIAAAATNNNKGIAGAAPDARILPVKAMNAEGKSVEAAGGEDSVVAAVRYAADQGAAVINLSLGDAGIPAVLGPSFGEAVRYAWSKGSICVVAAGNSGEGGLSNGFVTSSNFGNEPALVVTSTSKAGTKPAYASDIGAAKWGLAAPGGAGSGTAEDDILSAWWVAGRPNTYAYVAGTSMATPHVAGAAAVLRSLGLTPQQTVDRLLATARDIGAQGKDSVYGHGALDMKAAVAGLTPRPGPSVRNAPQAPASPPTTRRGRGATTSTSTVVIPAPSTTETTVLPTVEPPDDKTGGLGDDSLEAAVPQNPIDDDADGRSWGLLMFAVVALGAPLVLLGRLKPG